MFRSPCYPFVQALGVATALVLAVQMRPGQQLVGGLVLLLGALWFFGYARHHTKVRGVARVEVETRRMAREEAEPRREETRVLVPVANPLTERSLMTIGGAVARARGWGVTALNVIPVPDQTPLYVAQREYQARKDHREKLLEVAARHGQRMGVEVEEKAIFSHSVPTTIIGAAQTREYNLILMGWQGEIHRYRGLCTRGGVNVLRRAPCDIAVLRDRGHTYNRVLVPVGGGPHVGLGVEIARDLANTTNADVTLLSVVPGDVPEKRREMQGYVDEHARMAGIDARKIVVEGEDVSDAIVGASDGYDLVVLGASRRWLWEGLFGSIPDEVARRTQCSVLMVKRWEPRPVTWIRRLVRV